MSDFDDAVEDGDTAEVIRLLDADPGLAQAPGDGGDYPLHLAAWQGHADLVRLLLDRGADVNAIGCEGQTALHYAVRGHDVEIVKMLMAANADLNVIDDGGLRPIASAALSYTLPGQESQREVFETLKKGGACYDLMTAGAMGDLSRVTEILAEEPDAAKEVQADANLLAAVAMTPWSDVETRVKIFDLLFESGFHPSQAALSTQIELCVGHGDYDEMAQYLRSSAKRFR